MSLEERWGSRAGEMREWEKAKIPLLQTKIGFNVRNSAF